MIGKVIEGHYKGASVNKLPDKNVLFIQTKDGTKIALSKSNVVSIDDVTDQYPSYGRKVMMVMWNDFETSIIQIGNALKSSEKNQQNETNENPNNIKNEAFYLGSKIVSKNDIQRLKEIIASKDKIDALEFMRETFGLGAADAMYIVEHFETLDFSKPQSFSKEPNDGNTFSESKKSEAPNNPPPQKGIGCFTWFIIIVLLSSLLNMCDGRTEAEKWEDSYKGAYREYAEFYGWHQD